MSQGKVNNLLEILEKSYSKVRIGTKIGIKQVAKKSKFCFLLEYRSKRAFQFFVHYVKIRFFFFKDLGLVLRKKTDYFFYFFFLVTVKNVLFFYRKKVVRNLKKKVRFFLARFLLDGYNIGNVAFNLASFEDDEVVYDTVKFRRIVVLYENVLLSRFLRNRSIFDLNVMKVGISNVKTLLKENFFIFNCCVRLVRNNLYLVFYRVSDGFILYSITTGVEGFKGKKKKTPIAAYQTSFRFAKGVISRLRKMKVSLEGLDATLFLYGALSSVIIKESCKGLYHGGLNFVKIVDSVKVEHSGGLTKKKARRV